MVCPKKTHTKIYWTWFLFFAHWRERFIHFAQWNMSHEISSIEHPSFHTRKNAFLWPDLLSFLYFCSANVDARIHGILWHRYNLRFLFILSFLLSFSDSLSYPWFYSILMLFFSFVSTFFLAISYSMLWYDAMQWNDYYYFFGDVRISI